MKILYTHQYFNTPLGVGGIRSYEFARHFIKAGHEVHVLCGEMSNANCGLTEPFQEGKRSGTHEGIRITQFAVGYSNHLGFIGRVRSFLHFVLSALRVVMTADYDVIYATSTPLTVGILGIAAKVFRRKKFIFEVRDLWPELPREMGVIKNPVVLWAMSQLEFLSYYFADACVGLSPGMVEGIKRVLNGEKKEVVLIPNGCDNDLFQGSSDGKSILQQNFSGKFLAGYFGALGIANGLDYLVEAATILAAQKRDEIVILIYGDGREKSRLQQMILDRGLVNIKLMGVIPKVEVARTMREVDVGLLILMDVPAFYNGTSPNKFFDYISAGIPVINNQQGWVATLLKSSSCGLSANSRNPSDLAAKLVQLSETPEAERRSMGKRARQLAETEFERTMLAERCLGLIERVEKS